MDILEKYEDLIKGEPLRIKPDDMAELMSIVSSIGNQSIINCYGSLTDVIVLSGVVNQLVQSHNTNLSLHRSLQCILIKIFDYNK